ncbi:MAG: aminotransferase class V-fold PLP-dependent enzyme [Clostridioides sp.]|nr:aminotransferase class V-fold PLP-dependent enzyme [Clostridioides sp.]
MIDTLVKNRELVSFHMPGHKYGKLFKKLGYDKVLNELYSLDTTEIIGTDNLHNSSGIIKEAEENLARIFETKESFFLVNGTTCGIQAAIMSACQQSYGNSERWSIITNRDAHQCVTNVAIFSDINIGYIPCEVNEKNGALEGVKFENVRNFIEDKFQESNSKVLVLTYPTYYGMTYDIKSIIEYAHSKGMIVIVDEAHGAHFGLNDKLPKSSLEFGADIVVQSFHKTLGGFTQSAVLHINSDRIDTELVSSYLRMIESSSPSYLLMASLEISTDIYDKYGKKLMKELIKNIEDFQSYLEKEKIFAVQKMDDITKLFISSNEFGMTGEQLEEVLRYDYGIQVELSNYYGVLLICTIGNDKGDFSKLKEALIDIKIKSRELIEKNIEEQNKTKLSYTIEEDIEKQGKTKLRSIIEKNIEEQEKDNSNIDFKNKNFHIKKWPKKIPERRISLNKAFKMQAETVKIENSVGMITKESAVPYPPGISIISPGEVITQEIIDYLIFCKKNGMQVNGLKDKNIENIDIVIE